MEGRGKRFLNKISTAQLSYLPKTSCWPLRRESEAGDTQSGTLRDRSLVRDAGGFDTAAPGLHKVHRGKKANEMLLPQTVPTPCSKGTMKTINQQQVAELKWSWQPHSGLPRLVT